MAMDYWERECRMRERQEKRDTARLKKIYRSVIRKWGLSRISITSGGHRSYASSITFGPKLPEDGTFNRFAHREDGPAVICFQENGSLTVRRHIYYQNNRQHREDGPSNVDVKRGKEVFDYNPMWTNGCEWYLRGVRVHPWIIMEPEKINLRTIGSEGNIEIKRVMIERFGWVRYLQETNAKVIDSRTDEISGTKEVLFRVLLGSKRVHDFDKNHELIYKPTRTASKILVCACPSTGRVYPVQVANNVNTCEEAQEWLRGPTIQNITIIGAS